MKQTHEARQTRGRPVHLWALTGAGHGRFPDGHQTLSIDLIDAVERCLGNDQLSLIVSDYGNQQLERYGKQLLAAGDDLGVKLGLLAELRSTEGFMAEVRLLPDGWLLIENHCPLHAAARRCPQFCDSELSMLRALLKQQATVERADHLLAGARRCAFKITAHNARSA